MTEEIAKVASARDSPISEEELRRFQFYLKPQGDCICFIGGTDSNGYGRFWLRGSMRLAHHVSWFCLYGVQKDLYLAHSCNTPACCNPEHLRRATHMENMQDLREAGYHSNRTVDPTVARRMRAEGKELAIIAAHFTSSKVAVSNAIIRHYGRDIYDNRI